MQNGQIQSLKKKLNIRDQNKMHNNENNKLEKRRNDSLNQIFWEKNLLVSLKRV